MFTAIFSASVFSLTLDNSVFFGKVGGFKTIRDRAASLTVGDQMLVLGGRDPTGSDLISFEVIFFLSDNVLPFCCTHQDSSLSLGLRR